MPESKQPLKFDLVYQGVSYLLIILGIVIRLYQFGIDRSLWLDEAMLSNNIVNRSFTELLQPLDERQIAPIGFILVQKLLTVIFGSSDTSLRIFPLITGIASIIIFYLLIRRLAGEKYAPAGLLLFITGEYLIFHQTEAKQYGMDVFAYITLFYFLYYKQPDLKNYKEILRRGILGAVLIWFSHCSILFLTGIVAATGIEILITKKYRDLKGYLVMGSIWLISFGINYFHFLHNHSSRSIQEEAFAVTGNLPPDGSLIDKLQWLSPLLKQTIRYAIYNNISTFCYLIPALFGLWYLIRGRQYKILALVIPFMIHLILVFLKLYPFGGRFNLYFGVFIILTITLGIRFISENINIKGIPVAGLILLLLAIKPAKIAFTPFRWEEIKEPLEYIEKNRQSNDAIYIHHASVPAYKFYRSNYLLGENIIQGTFRTENEIDTLKNSARIWFLMTHYDQTELTLMDKYRESGYLVEVHEYYRGYVGLLMPTRITGR